MAWIWDGRMFASPVEAAGLPMLRPYRAAPTTQERLRPHQSGSGHSERLRPHQSGSDLTRAAPTTQSGPGSGRSGSAPVHSKFNTSCNRRWCVIVISRKMTSCATPDVSISAADNLKKIFSEFGTKSSYYFWLFRHQLFYNRKFRHSWKCSIFLWGKV